MIEGFPMRAVVQRVKDAWVSVDGGITAEIGRGLLVLVGVETGDTEADAAYIARKCEGLRIFEDASGLMNLSVKDIGGEALVISQFTLLGDARRGRRPSFAKAMAPPEAERLYLLVASGLEENGVRSKTGIFGARMEVGLVNEGPVTILLDSRKAF